MIRGSLRQNDFQSEIFNRRVFDALHHGRLENKPATSAFEKVRHGCIETVKPRINPASK